MQHLSRKNISLLHVFFVAPLLMYIGYNGANSDPRLFQLLMIIAVVVIFYHGKNLMRNMSTTQHE
jgi:hypothetical protein